MANINSNVKASVTEEGKVKGILNRKRKVSAVIIHQHGSPAEDGTSKKQRNGQQDQTYSDIDTSRPTALFEPIAPRNWTVSIALPGSWLSNARKLDHKTMQVGRIARAAAVFCVDEIVVFDDGPCNINTSIIDSVYVQRVRETSQHLSHSSPEFKQAVLDSILEEDEPWQNPDQFMYHVLAFAECPPYLRFDSGNRALSLFPMHKNLEHAGCLPSLDMPHHLKSHEWCQYREGVVVGTKRGRAGKVQVRVGLPYPISVPIPDGAALEPGMRTTVRFENLPPPSWPNLSQEECDALEVFACASCRPREEIGYYWGYNVRRAVSLSDVFSDCSFEGGYDFTVGTSERGRTISSILPRSTDQTSFKAPQNFKHLLLVFGGVAGLEPAVANDPVLRARGLGKGNASELFDAWVNLVPGQGSRTIRTEEAVEFGLLAMYDYVQSNYEA